MIGKKNLIRNNFIFITLILFLSFKIFDMKKIDTNCDQKLLIYQTNFSNYKYLYVGSYFLNNSLVNYVYLYLINSQFLPASKIISEEPGIISNCLVQKEQISNFNSKKYFSY